ncbi:MAG: CDP-alcohol phosphatidyltransferase family protein, partial [Clostridia bacterium]|nr:CDP-alcohol phosphatidyltransferase family protein [Clostridia bacterium]
MDDLGNKLVPEAKKRNIGAANIITGTRILLSIALLFCKAMSPVFYTLYIAAGISDILDGAIARKTNTVSDFGSKLDTAADLI